MRRAIIVLALYTLPCAGFADKGRSIMFGEPDPIYQERTRDTTADEQAEHCKQLRAQMQELKYRPLRRNAVVERYRIECRSDDAGHSPMGLQ
jgi:thymidylate synthase